MRCCNARGCADVFDAALARKTAERYRRRGLDRSTSRIVDLVADVGVDGATVLEVGGGLGAAQLALLDRGAARTVNLELSPAYEHEAQRLLAERGLTGRAERRIHDIAAEPAATEEADIVLLHRVVCCYPDYERLLLAAAARARRALVFSYPRANAVSRLVAAAQNLVYRLRGLEFRGFVHPPEAMLAVVERSGLPLVRTEAGPIWRYAVLSRRNRPKTGS